MKKLFILVWAVWSTTLFAQDLNSQVKGIVIDQGKNCDSAMLPKVVYQKNEQAGKNVACFLNGKLISETALVTINPSLIQSIDIDKKALQIGNITYNGQVRVKTKGNYAPEFITLNELKRKYTDLKDKPSLFMIDDKLVNGNYDQYFVDEHYILKIVIDKIKDNGQKIDLGLIRLLTKSDKNMQDSKTIRIRGNGVSLSR